MKHHEPHDEPENLNLAFQVAHLEQELASYKQRTREAIGDLVGDVTQYVREAVHTKAGYVLTQEVLIDIDEQLAALDDTIIRRVFKR
ncbi:hypothetical protein DB345_12325 [Spartobacteria bacterium LR76]|nr:hypothetical protein DB345_12325 [Spartobacteria bacterium LR76]